MSKFSRVFNVPTLTSLLKDGPDRRLQSGTKEGAIIKEAIYRASEKNLFNAPTASVLIDSWNSVEVLTDHSD